MRRSSWAFVTIASCIVTTACQSKTTAGTGRTEHERDSVIGQSQVPGAPVVKKALDVADSSRNRVAQEDSAAAAP